MNKSFILGIGLIFSCSLFAAENNSSEIKMREKPEENIKLNEEKGAAQEEAVSQTCYSARKCGGKVLNHKDRHNCKNSGGKSWEDRNGTCYNL